MKIMLLVILLFVNGDSYRCAVHYGSWQSQHLFEGNSCDLISFVFGFDEFFVSI